MNTCLQDRIGLRGICDEPESGLFINSLPGINLKMMEAVADAGQPSFSDLWRDILDRSIMNMNEDIKQEILKTHKIRNQGATFLTGEYQDPFEIVAAASDKYQGVFLDVRSDPNLEFVINTVRIYLDADTTFTLYVWDAETGSQLKTVLFDGKKGHNEIKLNLKYQTYANIRKVFIGYNTAEVSDFRRSSLRDDLDDCYDCDCHGSIYTIIKGFQIDNTSDPEEATITEASESFGIVVSFGVRCSVENFVCNNVDQFDSALLWKAGVELLTEQMVSDRLNKYTLIPNDEIEAMIDSFESQYLKRIDSAIKNVHLDSTCFECDKRVKYQIDLP